MRNPISIADRKIGPDEPPYIIAEISGNHNGSLERALKIVRAAAKAGADAVKLQTYTADTITIDHDSPEFTIQGGPWAGRTLHELYEEAHTPWEWHEALFAEGTRLGVCVFSSPFDATAINFLEKLNAPAYKIASFEAIDLPLIRKVAATGKPMIISTGMADEIEIGEAVEAAREGGCQQLALLHCVSSYPTPPQDANLLTIPDLRSRFGVTVGLSDHTLGTSVATTAVALGASIIEKHVTLDRSDGGPDASFSLEPDELATLCQDTKTAFAARGHVSYERKESEEPNAQFRRSLYVVQDIAKGDILSEQNIRSIRPGHGLAPKFLPEILGRPVTRDVSRGTPMNWTLISETPK